MRIFFAFILLFSSFSASAELYFWKHNDSAFTADSPAPILNWWTSNMPAFGMWKLADTKITKVNDATVKLEAWWLTTDPNMNPSSWTYTYSSASRFGDSCNEDELYSDSEFTCLPKPNDCASSAGTTAYHLSATGKTRTSPDAPWPSGSVAGSPTMCSGSCQFSLAQANQVQCGSLKGGDPLIQYCLFKYSGTGQSCSPGDPAQNSGSTAPAPPTDPNDPTDPANNCGPTHVWSGSVCVPKLDPDPADPTDPGTGGTDPGTGGGGPGTGGGDPGTGGGDPGTGGGDPGTGGGDPGDDGPDEEGDVVKGEACDLDLTCEGDALQCAMLRQQKADRCNWQIDEKQTKQIVDSFTGDKYKLGESSTDIGSSFSTALNAPRFLPSSCPPPQRINIQGRSYSLPWSYVCDFASGLSYLIVAMAGVFFVTYVGRGFGGD